MTLSVTEVFEELAKQRVCIRIEGDRIFVPKGRLPGWLVDGVRQNRQGVIEALNATFDGKIPRIVDCSPPEPEF